MVQITPLERLRVPIGGQEIQLQQVDHEAGGMSMLLLDIGNSRLRWVLHGSGWWEPRSALHRSGKIENLLDEVWEGMPTPEKIVVVSVAGPAMSGVPSGTSLPTRSRSPSRTSGWSKAA